MDQSTDSQMSRIFRADQRVSVHKWSFRPISRSLRFTPPTSSYAKFYPRNHAKGLVPEVKLFVFLGIYASLILNEKPHFSRHPYTPELIFIVFLALERGKRARSLHCVSLICKTSKSVFPDRHQRIFCLLARADLIGWKRNVGE